MDMNEYGSSQATIRRHSAREDTIAILGDSWVVTGWWGPDRRPAEALTNRKMHKTKYRSKKTQTPINSCTTLHLNPNSLMQIAELELIFDANSMLSGNQSIIETDKLVD